MQDSGPAICGLSFKAATAGPGSPGRRGRSNTKRLRENGLECLSLAVGGNLPIVWAYNWKRLLISIAMLPLRPIMRGEKDGWVLCYHVKKVP